MMMRRMMMMMMMIYWTAIHKCSDHEEQVIFALRPGGKASKEAWLDMVLKYAQTISTKHSTPNSSQRNQYACNSDKANMSRTHQQSLPNVQLKSNTTSKTPSFFGWKYFCWKAPLSLYLYYSLQPLTAGHFFIYVFTYFHTHGQLPQGKLSPFLCRIEPGKILNISAQRNK